MDDGSACRMPGCPAVQARRKEEGKKAGKRLRPRAGLMMDAPSRPSEAELRLNSRSRRALKFLRSTCACNSALLCSASDRWCTLPPVVLPARHTAVLRLHARFVCGVCALTPSAGSFCHHAAVL